MEWVKSNGICGRSALTYGNFVLSGSNPSPFLNTGVCDEKIA